MVQIDVVEPQEVTDKVGGKSSGKVWIGFDLGGTKMLCKSYTDKLKEVSSRRKKTKSRKSEKSLVDRIIETIEDTLKEAGKSKSDIAGIGLGCPGILDLKTGTVLNAPNLGWKKIPLKKILADHFDCPVVIGNDVDLGVYGEYTEGAGKGAYSVLGIFPGTGIGGGFIYQGDILTGSRSSCMEIGHMCIQPEGRLCGCGRRGCLETVASRLAIAAQAAKAVYRGEAPVLKELAGTNIAEIRSGVLAESIEKGDESIKEIVTSAAEHIGRAIANMVNLLAPDVVILGGGLVEAMPKLIVDTAYKTSKNHCLKSAQDSYKVVAAKLGDDSTVLGAAGWARHIFDEGKKKE
ncbi:MAG: transcriptional regulator [Planctomyces sp.]|nr:transcriptional regulator [Planctomyces sp.]